MKQVMKFGGAALQDADGVKNVADLIKQYAPAKVVIIVSAMAKTTNALEQLAHLAATGNVTDALIAYEQIYQFHYNIIQALGLKNQALTTIKTYFSELRKLVDGIILLQELSDSLVDRFIAYGELFSAMIVQAYLQKEGLNASIVDAHAVIITNAKFRRAEVIESKTFQKIVSAVTPLWAKGDFVVLPGFIGATEGGRTTTLGREGSDYTAALVASALGVDKLVIWKDVPGIMSADPKKDPSAQPLAQISYSQAVSMTYYGATVLHPKTLAPLQARNIPLHVKCFKDASLPGTLISNETVSNAQFAITSVREKQLFLKLTLKPFTYLTPEKILAIWNQLVLSGWQTYFYQIGVREILLGGENRIDLITNFCAALQDEYNFSVVNEGALVCVDNPSMDFLTPNSATYVQRSPGSLQYTQINLE